MTPDEWPTPEELVWRAYASVVPGGGTLYAVTAIGPDGHEYFVKGDFRGQPDTARAALALQWRKVAQ
jgi:hypothetical protein